MENTRIFSFADAERSVNDLTDDDKRDIVSALKKALYQKSFSSPNGSAYSYEALKDGLYERIEIKTVYNLGYYIGVDSIFRLKLAFDQRGVGTGTDLGKHYCSQDQELAEVHNMIDRW